MEEKKGLRINISIVLLFIAIIVIIGLAYGLFKLYNEKNTESAKVSQLQTQVSDMNGTISGLQEQINNISKNTNSDKSISQNSNTVSNEKNNTSKNTKNENKIILDGMYVIEASDVGFKFDKNGNVTIIGCTEEQEGTYSTISENEIEIKLTKETTFDVETGESTSISINSTEKIKVIDDNTILVNNEKLSKITNN